MLLSGAEAEWPRTTEDPIDLLREHYPHLPREIASAFAQDFHTDIIARLGSKSIRYQAYDSMMMSEARDLLMLMLSRVLDARDSKLSVSCLFFAMGLPPLGVPSFRHLAKRHGVSVQAVSDEVEAFQSMIGLPKTDQQKSIASRKTYKLTNGAETKAKI
jgi:hypothetical protein